MKNITILALAMTLAMTLTPGAAHADQARLGFAPEAREPVAVAPEAWSRQDPADSLYRAAREAMNRGDHERAARLFRQVWERHPRSTYAPDAPYWEAFNLYRVGGMSSLERAVEALELQKERYARASTRQNGDALALRTRIRGQLARRGDESAAESIVVAANELAEMVTVDPEFMARMEAMGERMAAEGERLAEELAVVAEHAVDAAFGGRSRLADIPEECREQTELQLEALNALLHMNADRAMPVLKKVMARRDPCAPPLRRRAVFLIADKASPEAVDLLLAAARSDPDVEVRRQAVFWLSEVDDPRAVEALQRVLRESDDERVRERAVFALSQHDSPAARRTLRSVAQDRGAPRAVRAKAIFWLGHEGGPEDVEFLKSQFGRMEAPELNEQILVAVGQAERREDARWLLSVASDAQVDRRLREKAIFWAAEAGAAAESLATLYDQLQDRALKEKVLFGLSESEQPQAIEKLIQIARTEKDAGLRRKAVFWLGNSNDPRAAEVLMELVNAPPPGR